tara:strand:+ start:2991 stop:3737 length:747 start_codon:yes stop_codon:yes gene_type:complete
MTSDDYPYISICMPIADRNNFKRLIVSNLLKLEYDKNKLEFIILDDGDESFISNNDELNMLKSILYPIQLVYKYDNIKKEIGHKRNILTKMAKHNIIACFDSDDYYLSYYLKHSIDVMRKGKHQIVSSPQMLFVFPYDDWLITGIDCKTKRQGHEATMVYTRKHWRAMGGFNKKGHGEGTGLIDGMKDGLIGRTEIKNCMICICHGNNSVNKDRFKENNKMPFQLPENEKKLIMGCLKDDFEIINKED